MKNPVKTKEPRQEEASPIPQLDFKFLSKLCHELKAPLFPLIALTDLILNHPQTLENREEMIAHVNVMQRAGHSLLAIIDDLRLLSQLGAGRYTPKVARFNLRKFFANQAHEPQDMWVFDDKMDAQEIIGDSEALEIFSASFASIRTAYSPRPTSPIKVTANKSKIRLSISLPAIPSNELKGLEPPFIRPPWSILEEAENQSLKFDVCFALSKALGGEASFEIKQDSTLFSIELPCARPYNAQRHSSAEKKFVLVSENLRDSYAALLRCHSEGLAISSMTAQRAASAAQAAGITYLVDETSSDSLPKGQLVNLHELPEAIL
ncbi:MAG: histidine kinase dimerization/phospho-acceptor domain-containing protein [Myxococcota bacterium]|nr:histidine kinase dimerization/phospho-acceptor domain-containing protein [Myxococcota bacterium]